MTVSKLCGQIEETETNYTEKEVIQRLLCIIKPGEFRTRLISNDDMTVAKHRKVSESHIRIRKAAVCIRQHISYIIGQQE